MAWTIRNGATYDPTRKVYRANTSTKGISDILGILPGGRFLAIEVKTKTGRLTPHQRAFLNTVNLSGGLGLLARDVADLSPVWEALGHPSP